MEDLTNKHEEILSDTHYFSFQLLRLDVSWESIRELYYEALLLLIKKFQLDYIDEMLGCLVRMTYGDQSATDNLRNVFTRSAKLFASDVFDEARGMEIESSGDIKRLNDLILKLRGEICG